MHIFKKKVSQKAGMSPGTLFHVGNRLTEKAKITLFRYNPSECQETELQDIDGFEYKPEGDKKIWLNIDGIHDMKVIERIGDLFNLHPLVLEDILNTTQRPKFEESDSTAFIVIKMLAFDDDSGTIHEEQVSILFGSNFVLSFQEKPGDVFDSVRERIRHSRGRVRKMGSDYLAYALMDVIVDYYYAILENIGEQLEKMEDDLISNPTPETLQKLYVLKREMVFLRKAVWPMREVVSALLRSELTLIKRPTRPFLRDLYDHTVQVIDVIETLRDVNSGMLDVYLSSVSNRMNEIMKLLTIIATIFIPLTFIAGLYGMNFSYMPELTWHWGYFLALSAMALVGLVMAIYFKRKKWL